MNEFVHWGSSNFISKISKFVVEGGEERTQGQPKMGYVQKREALEGPGIHFKGRGCTTFFKCHLCANLILQKYDGCSSVHCRARHALLACHLHRKRRQGQGCLDIVYSSALHMIVA